jgi:hypothetical protein
VNAYLKRMMLVDKFMFMTFFLILKNPNFQCSVAKLKRFW